MSTWSNTRVRALELQQGLFAFSSLSSSLVQRMARIQQAFWVAYIRLASIFSRVVNGRRERELGGPRVGEESNYLL